ncbi:MAG TPA: ATP-binding protein, partial [Candidatus Dormibacteraeota bacterium]|nr:ATP-binding protein [Candidatus Dormibacteraeota bacterium]
QLPLRIELVDAGEIARGVAERFTPLAAGGGVAIEVPAAACLARGDRDRIAQVLSNYLSNGIRHAPPDTTISVTARSADGRVRIGVRDRGAGLAPDQLDAVFERFYRVDPARSRAGGGSGIGLAIARALAEAMDGSAWAKIPPDGPGVEFVLELPAATP